MTKKEKDVIEKYRVAANSIVTLFSEKHFDGATDWYWIGGEIGGVIVINDFFFNTEDMVQYILYDYTTNELLERYDEEVNDFKTAIPNIKNWKKL